MSLRNTINFRDVITALFNNMQTLKLKKNYGLYEINVYIFRFC